MGVCISWEKYKKKFLHNYINLDVNCEKLLDSNFLVWCQIFGKSSDNPVEFGKALFQVHQLIVKLFYYDLLKPVILIVVLIVIIFIFEKLAKTVENY